MAPGGGSRRARLATIGAAVVALLGELEGDGPRALPALLEELRANASLQAALHGLLGGARSAPAVAPFLHYAA